MPSKYPERPDDDHTPVSTQELLDVIEVGNIVHTVHEEAAMRDEKDMAAGVAAGDSGAIMERTYFVLEKNVGDESLPCGYDQMVLRLREPTLPLPTHELQISTLTVKIPRLSLDFHHILPLPEGATRWNDFVAEVDYEDGQRGRYLVNSRGVSPFPSSEALVDAYLHEGAPADLFSVPNDLHDWTVPPLTASRLLHFIVEEGQLERQTQPS